MRTWIGLILCYLIMGGLSLQAQPYFSKLKYNGQEGVRLTGIEQIDSNTFFIQAHKYPANESTSYAGWYLMDGTGNFVDSFFFQKKGLQGKGVPSDYYFIKDDLVYEVIGRRGTELVHSIFVSSLTTTDSVNHFPIDFGNHNWNHISGASFTRGSDDHMYFFASGTLPGTPRKHDVFMMKFDLEGNQLWLKHIDQWPGPDDPGSYHWYNRIMSDVIEIDDHLYFTNMAFRSHIGGYNASRVYKVSKDGELIWRSAREDNGNRSQGTPNITLSEGRSSIIWMNNRQSNLDDLDISEDSLFQLSHYPISVTLLDTADGSFQEDFLYFVDNNQVNFGTNKVITSHINGDYIFSGVIVNSDIPDGSFYWNHPLVGRVSKEGDFKWVKFVADRWGNDRRAKSFYDHTEAANGDILLVGELGKWLSSDLQNEAGWVMRIGPNGCVPGHTYCNEDTLIINHPTIVLNTADPTTAPNELSVWPNPLQAGDPIHFDLEDEEGFLLRGPAIATWYTSDGRQVAEEHLSVVDRQGYRAQVPPRLSPGLYFVEMQVGRERYVARLVVQ